MIRLPRLSLIYNYVKKLIFIRGSVYDKVRPGADYSPWLIDESFQSVYKIIKNYTLIDKYRLYELWQLVEQISTLKGDILEVGVWKGGSSMLLAYKSKDDTVFCCDTFEGVVKTSCEDHKVLVEGIHKASINDINFLNETFQLNNIRILKGIFPEETGHKIAENKFKFVHIDVDVYQSAKDIFDFVWCNVVKGGIVVFDDYGFQGCKGITMLVNKLSLNDDNIFIHNLNGHAVLIKLN